MSVQQPKWMYRRKWSVTHGRDGFMLWVRDEWVPYLVAEKVNHAVLAALGHPCCGRGLGRISGDWIDLFWYRWLNLPHRLYRFGKPVIEIPLTVEQAFTLAPHWRDEEWVTIDGVDDYGGEWRDGVMVREPDLTVDAG